jgi:hypothetical protein
MYCTSIMKKKILAIISALITGGLGVVVASSVPAAHAGISMFVGNN